MELTSKFFIKISAKKELPYLSMEHPSYPPTSTPLVVSEHLIDSNCIFVQIADAVWNRSRDAEMQRRNFTKCFWGVTG